MIDFIEHLQNYSKPMKLGSISGNEEDALSPHDQTDEEFEIEILEWVLEQSEEPGVNEFDLRGIIQDRIWELKL